MEPSSKSFRLLTVLALLLCIGWSEAFAETPADVQPNTGSVDGSRYTSKFFGFTYSFPEQWTVRSVAGRMPGNGAWVLLSLKPKTGTGGLSTMMISAAQLPTANDAALWRYMIERYRLNQAPDSDTTINGIPTSRIKRSAAPPEPSILMFGDRTFYRLRLDNAAMSRIAIATIEKGHALVFESIVPRSAADETESDLISSLHTVTFGTTNPVSSDNRH